MLGAIIGDIVGSRWEFNPTNDYNFEWLSEGNGFTDDTICTVGVADALLNGRDFGECIHDWCRRYPSPKGGYGGRFAQWVHSDAPQPYNSFGNGSAMRVAAVGWLFDDLDTTRKVARWTAEVTHNHPEGIKGAEATVSAIFMARTGGSKEEIKDYIINEFGYDFSRTCDEIRPDYYHVESCQETVPEAITAFMEGNDFEDVIRTAVSLGGDCDTLTCIAGSIAEAYYSVPYLFKKECEERLPVDIKEVLQTWNCFNKPVEINELE